MSYSPAPPELSFELSAVLAAGHDALRRVRFLALLDDRRHAAEMVAVRVFSAVARAAGSADAVLVIHGASWDASSPSRRTAALDAALATIRPVMADGRLARDQAGRPVLRRRKPRLAVAIDPGVLARHGSAAFDRAANDELQAAIVKATEPGRRNPGRPRPLTVPAIC